jgi:uncharacterized protein (DUF2147 family)
VDVQFFGVNSIERSDGQSAGLVTGVQHRAVVERCSARHAHSAFNPLSEWIWEKERVIMMKIRIAKLSAVAMVLVALVACNEKSTATAAGTPSGPANTVNVSGKYKILSASNPDGRGGYSGSVAITERGDMYAIDWTIANTAPYKGVGIVTGQVLGVGWGVGAEYGVAVYTVNGGTLDGKWATSSTRGHAGIEKLSGPAGLNGTYKITEAKDGDSGKTYTGTVTISPSGAVYNVTWTLPGQTYSGVGILQGSVLTVGWGTAGKGAGVVVYQVGDKLDGKWAQPRGTMLGAEVLGKT